MGSMNLHYCFYSCCRAGIEIKYPSDFYCGAVDLIRIFHLHETVILNSCGFARAVLRSGQIPLRVPRNNLKCLSGLFAGNLWIFCKPTLNACGPMAPDRPSGGVALFDLDHFGAEEN